MKLFGRTAATVEAINFKVFASEKAATATWEVSTTSYLGGFILVTQVVSSGATVERKLLDASKRSALIENLTPGISYRFTIYALHEEGAAKYEAKTLPAKEEPPVEKPPVEEPKKEPKFADWVPNSKTFKPLSDTEAAALVTHKPEIHTDNSTYNYYVPSEAELAAFHAADNFSPYGKYVSGQSHLTLPSTDDLIQWGAHKWGINEDWLRAEYGEESTWHQLQGVARGYGDRATVSAEWYAKYVAPFKIAGTSDVYESCGITSIKWKPDGSEHPGTEPLRWKSTAFNIDYQLSIIRAYYDNPNGWRSSWGDSSYKEGDQWGSIGQWFSPFPANNPGALEYIKHCQERLAKRVWEAPGF